jgi:hypothetical protein
MADPKKFKPYYIVQAFSKTQNKIRENLLTTEMGRMVRLDNLTIARKRSREFANSLNESKTLGTNDWQPMIHLQYTKSEKILVPSE